VHVSFLVVPNGMRGVLDGFGHIREDHDIIINKGVPLPLTRSSLLSGVSDDPQV
jgi:hypothetical protein